MPAMGGGLAEPIDPAKSYRYRYRTRALLGPWQATVGAAIDDAIRAGQARVDAAGAIHWIGSGEIEVEYPLAGEDLGKAPG